MLVTVLLSHAGDGAAEVTWPRRDIDAESCQRGCRRRLSRYSHQLSNVEVPPPTVRVQPSTIKVPLPTLKVPPSTVVEQPPTVEVPPPTIRVQSWTVEVLPPTFKVSC
jgi:hypothetical protein